MVDRCINIATWAKVIFSWTLEAICMASLSSLRLREMPRFSFGFECAGDFGDSWFLHPDKHILANREAARTLNILEM